MRTKKRNLLFTLSFFIVFSTTMAFFSVPAAFAAETITLRFATYQPPTGIEGEAPKWLMEEITKRTNGQVKFEQYFGGSLLKAREILSGVQSGTADMGFVFTAYYPKELPVHSFPQVFIRGPVDPLIKITFSAFRSTTESIPFFSRANNSAPR